LTPLLYPALVLTGAILAPRCRPAAWFCVAVAASGSADLFLRVLSPSLAPTSWLVVWMIFLSIAPAVTLTLHPGRVRVRVLVAGVLSLSLLSALGGYVWLARAEAFVMLGLLVWTTRFPAQVLWEWEARGWRWWLGAEAVCAALQGFVSFSLWSLSHWALLGLLVWWCGVGASRVPAVNRLYLLTREGWLKLTRCAHNVAWGW
jgi:hypothetical protein